MAKKSSKKKEKWNIVKDVINRPTSRPSDVTLLWGIAWLIISSIVGWYFRIAPTSVLGFIEVGYIPLLWHVVLNVIIWIVSCVLPFAYATYVCRKTRTVELFGRMLYAHWPVMLLMLPGVVGDKVAYNVYMSGLDRYDLSTSFSINPQYSTLMLIMTCVILIWYLYWSYNAFSGTTKRNSVGIFALYVLVIMVSQYFTVITLEEVYESLLK